MTANLARAGPAAPRNLRPEPVTHPAIKALDNALSHNSEEITLRRVVGSNAATQQFVDCPKILANVRGVTAKELEAGIDQNSLYCIFSPTRINETGWPGGQPPGGTVDPRVPSKNRGDKAFVGGEWRKVQWADGLVVRSAGVSELVRIEMRVFG